MLSGVKHVTQRAWDPSVSTSIGALTYCALITQSVQIKVHVLSVQPHTLQ